MKNFFYKQVENIEIILKLRLKIEKIVLIFKWLNFMSN